MLAAEVARRLTLPLDRWEPVGALSEVTREGRGYLARLRRSPGGDVGDGR